MREIYDHRTNPANEGIVIKAIDEPGAGGANHLYMVEGFNTATNASDPFTARHGSPAEHMTILFQNGPIPEKGVNGVTQEVLLAVVIDRLRSFQEGPFKCRENALALTKCEEALNWLHYRTRNRIRRGVEGTHTV